MPHTIPVKALDTDVVVITWILADGTRAVQRVTYPTEEARTAHP
jgi:hypothetical protein